VLVIIQFTAHKQIYSCKQQYNGDDCGIFFCRWLSGRRLQRLQQRIVCLNIYSNIIQYYIVFLSKFAQIFLPVFSTKCCSRDGPLPEQPLGYNQRTTSGFISRNFSYYSTSFSLQRAIRFASAVDSARAG